MAPVGVGEARAPPDPPLPSPLAAAAAALLRLAPLLGGRAGGGAPEALGWRGLRRGGGERGGGLRPVRRGLGAGRRRRRRLPALRLPGLRLPRRRLPLLRERPPRRGLRHVAVAAGALPPPQVGWLGSRSLRLLGTPRAAAALAFARLLDLVGLY